MPNPTHGFEIGANTTAPIDDSVPAAAAEPAELGGGSRVKGPWSPDEDAVLTELVSKFGARNWSLIARGIPGRSGKSCRLRWCNQLDPGLKHKPFTDEEDHIIISAHAIHGNKWAAIAKLLPGRTDNAIKNHWNSTLRRRFADQERFKPVPSDPIDHNTPEKTKSSSEETLSVGDITMAENHSQQEDKVQPETFPPTNAVHVSATLSRPKPRISAFNVYNSPSGPQICSGSLIQASKPDFGSCKFIEDIMPTDPMVPLQCGYGCCSEGPHRTSLLGPEFVEYEELPAFSSQQLVAIATDLNNIAWIKSGLENNSSGGNAASFIKLPQGAVVGSGNGISEQKLRNGHVVIV